MLEQIEAQREYEARKKKPLVFDENGDIDDPAILEVSSFIFLVFLMMHLLITVETLCSTSHINI